MNRLAMTGLRACGLLIVVLLLGTTVRWEIPDRKETDRNQKRVWYFHPGKTDPSGNPDPSCQTETCHPLYPHGRNPTVSAFLNMHVRFVECLACHGADFRLRWVLKPAGAGESGTHGSRTEIVYSVRKEEKITSDPHALLIVPIPCRECHSESGRNALQMRGGGDLPGGFTDPISLRMIEQGARHWVPTDLR